MSNRAWGENTQTRLQCQGRFFRGSWAKGVDIRDEAQRELPASICRGCRKQTGPTEYLSAKLEPTVSVPFSKEWQSVRISSGMWSICIHFFVVACRSWSASRVAVLHFCESSSEILRIGKVPMGNAGRPINVRLNGVHAGAGRASIWVDKSLIFIRRIHPTHTGYEPLVHSTVDVPRVFASARLL